MSRKSSASSLGAGSNSGQQQKRSSKSSISSLDAFSTQSSPKSNAPSSTRILQFKCFDVNDEILKRLKSCMLGDINKPPNTKQDSLGMQMLPTFIRNLPDGKEQGQFFVVHIKTESFTLLMITIADGIIKITDEETFSIAEEVAAGTFRGFFFHIAYCIKQFVTVRDIDIELQIVICMGYPLQLVNPRSGHLIRWTKEHLRCTDFEKRDIATVLLDCLTMQGDLRAVVVLICNDTAALLMYASHMNKNCRLSVVIGSGTNAAYVDTNVKPFGYTSGMVMSTEWASFGEDGCIDFVKTVFDSELDSATVNPGRQVFEKMTSVLYIGELVRRIIVHCANSRLMFKDKLPNVFRTPFSIGCKELAQVDSDFGTSTLHTRLVLAHYNYTQPSNEDLNGFKLIVTKVITRSAYLLAAGISALIEHANKPSVTVGISGSLIRYMPSYKRLLQLKLRDLVSPTIHTELMVFQGVSAKGAAIAAAVVAKYGFNIITYN